jgi:hypothetical protein
MNKYECFICFENQNTVNLTLIKSHYLTSCNCVSYVHKKCFNSWLTIKDNCPLCRSIYYSKEKYSKAIAHNFIKNVNYLITGIIFCIATYLVFTITIINLIIIRGSIYHD